MRILHRSCHFPGRCSHLSVQSIKWQRYLVALSNCEVTVSLFPFLTALISLLNHGDRADLVLKRSDWTNMDTDQPIVSPAEQSSSCHLPLLFSYAAQRLCRRRRHLCDAMIIVLHFNLFNWNLISFALEINCLGGQINQIHKPQGSSAYLITADIHFTPYQDGRNEGDVDLALVEQSLPACDHLLLNQ